MLSTGVYSVMTMQDHILQLKVELRSILLAGRNMIIRHTVQTLPSDYRHSSHLKILGRRHFKSHEKVKTVIKTEFFEDGINKLVYDTSLNQQGR